MFYEYKINFIDIYMKYLNLGCGATYSTDEKWVNIDFNSYSKYVIGHNLLKGIPYEDDSFDLVYHSHILEHFNKEDGLLFLKECYRVLKPGGTIRIVVPNLEEIVKEYIRIFNLGIQDIFNEEIEEKYNWILLELFDQMIRKFPGGEMGKFLVKEDLKILDYIEDRVGDEAVKYRNWYFSKQNKKTVVKRVSFKEKIKSIFIKQKIVEYDFLNSGELHNWMYDQYSLTKMLHCLSFTEIKKTTGFESRILDWNNFDLDVLENKIRKPDSLFIEAIKI